AAGKQALMNSWPARRPCRAGQPFSVVSISILIPCFPLVRGSAVSGSLIAATVTFGGVDVNCDDTVGNVSTQLTVGTPPHTAGVWDVDSTLAGSSALSSLDRFTGNVATASSSSTIATTSGSTGGGTVDAITGTIVFFGGIAAASFTGDRR